MKLPPDVNALPNDSPNDAKSSVATAIRSAIFVRVASTVFFNSASPSPATKA